MATTFVRRITSLDFSCAPCQRPHPRPRPRFQPAPDTFEANLRDCCKSLLARAILRVQFPAEKACRYSGDTCERRRALPGLVDAEPNRVIHVNPKFVAEVRALARTTGLDQLEPRLIRRARHSPLKCRMTVSFAQNPNRPSPYTTAATTPVPATSPTASEPATPSEAIAPAHQMT